MSKQNYFAKNKNFNGSLAEIEESKNQILIDGESGEAIVSLSSLEISEKTKDELKLKNISRNDKGSFVKYISNRKFLYSSLFIHVIYYFV